MICTKYDLYRYYRSSCFGLNRATCMSYLHDVNDLYDLCSLHDTIFVFIFYFLVLPTENVPA